MVDQERLNTFMQKFYGYGSWDAKLWFVGMEEGGGKDLPEIDRRLSKWDGTDNLANLRDFHAALGGKDWFTGRPKIQSTWGRLIRVVLCARQKPCTTEDVREFQKKDFGAPTGDVALIELFPLPSPSTRKWIYADWKIPEIATRDKYRETLEAKRIEFLRSKIRSWSKSPRVVVFYGASYRRYWEAIAGGSFAKVGNKMFEARRSEPTLFIISPHPVARGVANSDFCDMGAWIAEQALPDSLGSDD